MTNEPPSLVATETPEQPSVLPALVLGFIFVVGGIVLLSLLVNNTWLVAPDHPDFVTLQRAVAIGSAEAGALIRAADWRLIALFLLGIVTTVSGAMMPLVYLVNLRLSQQKNALRQTPFHILLRQALWIGMWAAMCLWLHMNRTLGLAIGFLVAVLFILMEGFLLLRRRGSSVD